MVQSRRIWQRQGEMQEGRSKEHYGATRRCVPFTCYARSLYILTYVVQLQESLSPVFDVMRKSTQRYASSHKPSQTSPRKGNNVDVDNDKDDFAPIRTGAGSSTPVPSSRVTNAQNSEERVISMYLDILLMSQLLKSQEGYFEDKGLDVKL